MEKRNCQNCQGDQIEAICVNLDNNTTLQEFVDTTEESLEKLEKPLQIDLKGLAVNSKDFLVQDVLQLLINEIVTLKSQTGTTFTGIIPKCTLNWSPIKDCNDCTTTDCQNLQVLIDKVGEVIEKTDTW